MKSSSEDGEQGQAAESPEMNQESNNHKLTEQALLKSEATARALLNAPTETAILAELDGTIVAVNEAATRSLGKSAEELIGVNAFSLFPPDVAKSRKAQADLIVQTKQPVNFQDERAGRCFENRLYPVLNESGEVVRIAVFSRDITANKRAEEALQRSEAKFRGLVEASSDWIWEVDAEGVYTYVSPQAETILGYKPEEIVGKSPFDFMPPEEAKRVTEIFKELAEPGKPIVTLENINLHQDGRQIILETNGVPVFDEAGKVSGYRGMDRDITERKRADEQRELFMKFAEYSDLGFGWAELDGSILFANSTLAQMMGENSPEDALGKNVARYYSDELKQRLQQEILPVVMSKGLWAGELPLTSLKGEVTQAIQNIFLIRDDAGLPRFLANVITDITDHKRAEEALRKSEERFRELADALPETIFEADLELNLNYVNSGAYEHFGYTEQDFAKGMNGLQIIVPEDRQKGMENIKRRMQGESVGLTEYLALRKDGSTFPCLLHAGPIMREGKPVGIRGFIIDITDRKQVEVALSERNRELDELNVRLNEILFASKGLTFCSNIEQLGQLVMQEFTRMISAEGGGLFIKRGNSLVLIFSLDPGHSSLEIPLPLSENTIFGKVWAQKAPVLIRNIASQEEMVQSGWHGYQEGSLLSLPLLDDRGEMTGIISLHNKTNPPFTNQDRDLGMILSSLCCETMKAIDAVQALRDSEEQFRTVIEASKDAMITIDEDGLISLFNPAAEQIFKRDAESMLGRPLDSLMLKAHQGQQQKYVGNYLALGEPSGALGKTLELPAIRGDGAEVTVELSLSKGFQRGRPFVLGVMRDITERKWAEAAIATERDRAKNYLELANVIFLAVGADQQVTLINRKGCEVLGFQEEEIIGRNWFNSFLPVRDRNTVIPIFQQLMLGQVANTEYYENAVLTKSGEERMIAWHNTLIKDPAGNIVGTLSSGEDITERQYLEEQLRQAQKMEAVGQLAGGVAHDFNNLLQAIAGYTELSLIKTKEDDPRSEYLKEVKKASEKAASLTRQLLAFSRRQVLELTELDLNEVIGEVMKMVNRVIGDHISLEIAQGSKLGMIRADRGQIEQILMNLCVNARDAMPKGGKTTIETQNIVIDKEYCENYAWAKPGRYVMLSVSDTGCGMDNSKLEHIFEPFFTTKGPGEGTGLGLATVYGIVKQHGGMIHTYSEVDKGTAFKIYLPQVEQSAPVERKIIDEGPAPGGNETILIAEDAEAVRTLAEEILGRAGYTVLCAHDGEEALKVFSEHQDEIDLLLLDVVMPGMGGRAVFEKIKEVRSEIPTLFASGYSGNSIHTEFLQQEGLQLIQKPFSGNVLLSKVRETLDARST